MSRAGSSASSPPTSLAHSRLLNPDLLSPGERQALEAALLPARRAAANVDLVREGDRTDHLLIMVEGWACRYSTTRDGNRQLPSLLLPGDVSNLDTLMFERIDYGVRTITDTVYVTLARDRALALSVEYPAIARAFTWLAMVENTTLSKWALSLGRRSARQRLAHLLCELSVRMGAEEANRSSYPFPMTQELVADALGLTSVHVNRTMQQLRGEGLIATANRVMTLNDVARLRQIGGFDPRYLHFEPPADARLAM